jgi:ribosomal protein L32
MRMAQFSAGWHAGAPAAEHLRRTLLDKRRRYNRLYMRAWRADPAHTASERANRARWHYQRKLREALRDSKVGTEKVAHPVCGFCRRYPPVAIVRRLEIRDLAPTGYVGVRVPYCGEC